MKRTPISKTPVIYFLLVLLVAVIVVGCAGPHVYIHPSPGLDRIKRIAVLPFENFSKDDKAGDKVRVTFVIELLMVGSFDVMDIGEVDRILQQKGLIYGRSSGMPPTISAPGTEEQSVTTVPLSRQIGEALNVQAILLGSVEAYNAERVADRTIPEVSIAVRLIDVDTNIIIWASTHTRRGSAGIPILGWGKISSLSTLSQHVIQDMANALAKYTR